jgi:hypothetical protein
VIGGGGEGGELRRTISTPTLALPHRGGGDIIVGDGFAAFGPEVGFGGVEEGRVGEEIKD